MENLFNLAINESGVHQSFFTKRMRRLPVYNRAAVDVSELRGHNKTLTPIKSFVSAMKDKNVKDFYLQRTFAFGDVLTLIPVVRELEKKGFNPVFRTHKRFHNILHLLDILTNQYHSAILPKQYGLILDGTIERDHVESKLSKHHRVDLYFSAVGLKTPKKVDWSCDLARFEFDSEFIEEPYVVFQGKGSSFRKSLPDSTILFIIEKMNEAGIRVAYIGDRLKVKVSKNEMTKFYFTNLTYSQLFYLIGKAQTLISMDSSPMWISHYTKTPLIALLGPSRLSERITKHPLYPKKTLAVELNKLIDCESCFECAQKCNEKISCLNIEKEEVWRGIRENLNKLRD